MLELNKTYNVDCLEGAKMLPDNSIDCIVTSPPYYCQRDYGVAGQIGLEQTPAQYIERLIALFRELKRALKDTGTVWVNIGDSYAGSGKGAWKNKTAQKEVYVPTPGDPVTRIAKTWEGIKPKDLIGIPWMFAFAMRADGWYLRQDIIWHKPNPMPESVRDRCTKAHEYIFLFSKSPKYYFDAKAIAEPVATSTIKRCQQDLVSQKGSYTPGKANGPMKACLPRYGGNKYTATPDKFYKAKSGNIYQMRDRRNKRSVWTVSTKPCKEAHFATYPEDLITPCILAGCQAEGVVLDPFNGSGTTRIAANKLNRNAVGFELNLEYIRIEERRRDKELGFWR